MSARPSACNTKGAVATLRPPAAARKSARRRNRCMGTRRRAAGVRRSGACDRARAGPRPPCGHPWFPCGRGNRVGVCAPICSVDRSASRLSAFHGCWAPIDHFIDLATAHFSFAPWGAGHPHPEGPISGVAGLLKVTRLIREAGLARQCEARSRDRHGMRAPKSVNRPPKPGPGRRIDFWSTDRRVPDTLVRYFHESRPGSGTEHSVAATGRLRGSGAGHAGDDKTRHLRHRRRRRRPAGGDASRRLWGSGRAGRPACRAIRGAAGPRGQMGADAVRASRLPLSALIAAARCAHAVARSAAFGVQVKSYRIDFDGVRRLCARRDRGPGSEPRARAARRARGAGGPRRRAVQGPAHPRSPATSRSRPAASSLPPALRRRCRRSPASRRRPV